MKKIFFIFVIGGIIVYFSLPFFYLVSPVRIKNYVYRELCYHTVVDKIRKNSVGLDDFLKKTVAYVYTNMDSHNIPDLIDDTSWDAFVRGYGYCDQQAWAFCTLLSEVAIPARMVMLKSNIENSEHTVVEVYVDNKWRIIDPHLNAVYYKENELATFEDMQDSVNLDQVRIEKWSDRTPAGSIVLYKSYFNIPPERWTPLTKKHGILRKVVFSPLYFYYKLLGEDFSCFYQELYLMREENKIVAERNRYLTRHAF